MTNIQVVVVMAFGALIAVAGLWLLFTKNESGANRVKILGQEFEISTPALVVFLVGSAIFVLPFFFPRLQDRVAISNSRIKQLFSRTFSEEKEPNDSFSSATPISLDTRVKGKIAARDDRDIFVFRTSPTLQRTLRIYLENNSMKLMPQLTFYNALKSQVEKIYDSTRGADLEVPSLAAAADSTFYVEVCSALSVVADSIGDYELTIMAE
jgi:hypothetical protein